MKQLIIAIIMMLGMTSCKSQQCDADSMHCYKETVFNYTKAEDLVYDQEGDSYSMYYEVYRENDSIILRDINLFEEDAHDYLVTLDEYECGKLMWQGWKVESYEQLCEYMRSNFIILSRDNRFWLVSVQNNL